jgi:uncharacterized protein (DUF2141 family)
MCMGRFYLAAPMALALMPPVRAQAGADHAGGCTLRIHVDALRNARGNIGTVIYKSAAG